MIPAFVIEGEITNDGIFNFMSLLRSGANCPTNIVLESPGGESGAFMYFIEQIKKRTFNTFAGEVGSLAVFLFLLGKKRYAFEGSTFLFHNSRWGIGENSIYELELKLEMLKFEGFDENSDRYKYLSGLLGQAKQLRDLLIRFIVSSTKLSYSTVWKLMRDEITLTAYEAQSCGIAHEILPVSFLKQQMQVYDVLR